MPDFLTRRNGTWHFVRRVPVEFQTLDRRGIVKHSTKVKVADDRTGRRATRVALKLNDELETFWHGLAGKRAAANLNGYDDARRRARALGYDYLENNELVAQPVERLIERLEALVTNGLANDRGARAALLGTEARPSIMLSKLFAEYEELTKQERKDLSPEQLRMWRNERVRNVEGLVKVAGDKPIADLTDSDGMDYAESWRDRVVEGSATVKTANKAMGQLSRMLKDVSIRRRLGLREIFKGLQLRGEADKLRIPFETSFIQQRFLAPGTFDGLNAEARDVLFVMIETGMRLSEICNLQAHTIHLDAPIPFVQILPDGRRLKTEDSEREIPLVGVALEALKRQPNGFPRYRDQSSKLSATLNKFMLENNLRPSRLHTAYSLRHSFKDRLIAIEAPDNLIDNLMGHRTGKPKYGKGPPLELKLKYLSRMAMSSPSQP